MKHSSIRLSYAFLIFSLLSLSAKAAPLSFKKSCVGSAVDTQEKLGNYSGPYSAPEYLRKLEKEYAKSKDIAAMNLEIKRGDLDTGVLKASYQKSSNAHLWERASQTELLELDYALLLTEKKLTEFQEKGIHPSKVKGEALYEGFISMRSYLSQIPDESLNFKPRTLAKAYNILQSKNSLSFWDRFKKKLGFEVKEELPSKLPQIHETQSIILSKKLTQLQKENIEKSLSTLREVGLFSEEILKNLEAIQVRKKQSPLAGFAKIFSKENSFELIFKNSELRTHALKSLDEWIDREMRKIDENSENAIDPIELAGISEYALHFIRPFPEKNYVLAKAIKNRILQKYELAVDLRYDEGNLDYLDLNLQDFVNNVRKGIFYAIHVIDNNFTFLAGANVLDTAIGLHPEAELIDKLPQNIKDQLEKTIYLYKSSYSHAIPMGSNIRKKMMFRGQFFLSTDDIVYTYVKDQNRFYPISEMDLVLYSQGGHYERKSISQMVPGEEVGKEILLLKSPNKAFAKAIADNIEIFSKIVNQEVDPREIEIESIDRLLENNKKNNGLSSHFFYDFQKDLIDAALENNLDPKEYPLSFLATSRSYTESWARIGPTQLQVNVTLNRVEEINIGQITSAYTFRRNLLLKLRRDLQLYNNKLFEEKKELIDQERRNIYIAARSLLMPYIDFMNEAFGKKVGKSKHPELQDKEFHRYVRSHAYWKGLYIYFKESEWAYPTYEAALKNVDQKSFLASRNIAPENFNFQGLRTEAQQANFLIYKFLGKHIIEIQNEIDLAFREGRDLNPQKLENFFQNLVLSFLQEKNSEGKEKSELRLKLIEKIKRGIRKIATKVLKPKYSTRGLLASNQRFFLDNYLHSKGVSPQELKSTSINQFFLAKVQAEGTMNFIPYGSNYIYRLKIGEEAVNSEFSMYATEAEILENVDLGPIAARLRLVFKATEEELIQDPDNPLTQKTFNLLNKLVRFDKNYNIIPPQAEIFPAKQLSDVFPEKELNFDFEDFGDFDANPEFDGPEIFWTTPKEQE